MATGTGKRGLLQALMYWQFLNASRAPEDADSRATPRGRAGADCDQRLLDAVSRKMREGSRIGKRGPGALP